MTDPTDAELEAAGLDRRKWKGILDVVHQGNLEEAKLTVKALAIVRADYQKGNP